MINTEAFIMIIAAAMFYTPAYNKKMSYRNKPIWTAAIFFFSACLLALFINSVSIIFLQLALILSGVLHVNSLKFKNYWPHKIALHFEKFIILGVIVLILLSPLPYKTLVILALVGFRVLNNLNGYFPKNIFLSKKYIIYTFGFIFIGAIHFREAL